MSFADPSFGASGAGGAGVDDPAIRCAGSDRLSLALMDARNRSLRWAALFDAAPVEASAEFDPPRWLLGRIGWFQESWIARNVQRQRGARCDPRVIRLASIDADADRLYDGSWPRAARWAGPLPDADAVRRYLADTIEVTLDLLESAGDSDDALYFYRLALFHEDGCAEAFAEVAQATGRAVESSLLAEAGTRPVRPPLAFAARRWTIGAPAGVGAGADADATPPAGFVCDNEMAAHVVDLPDFEIDAQPVSWAQYAEFVADGGYDDARWWSADGWQWLRRDGRRVPRHVEQMRTGVLQRRFGSVRQIAGQRAVVHVTAHEAEAWCAWAGRRLPTEVEWDLAGHAGAARGFAWGEVREWTSSPYRAYPGFRPGPSSGRAEAASGLQRALRGASFATHGRLRYPGRRSALPVDADLAFSGFRSCAA